MFLVQLYSVIPLVHEITFMKYLYPKVKENHVYLLFVLLSITWNWNDPDFDWNDPDFDFSQKWFKGIK